VIEIEAKVASAKGSAMTVDVSMYAENLLTGERVLATSGSFIMVALDGEHKPSAVPPFKA
jgi:acyl-CoA hydrolase